MPEMNGDEAAKILYKDEKLKNIPVLSLSTSREKESIDKNLFKGNLIKPISQRNLLNAIKPFIPHKEEERKYSTNFSKIDSPLTIFKKPLEEQKKVETIFAN